MDGEQSRGDQEDEEDEEGSGQEGGADWESQVSARRSRRLSSSIAHAAGVPRMMILRGKKIRRPRSHARKHRCEVKYLCIGWLLTHGVVDR